MNSSQSKTLLSQTFDSVAEGYDGAALRFFPESAKYLVSCLDLKGDEEALDVATGTGNAALALAARLPRGRVTGVDFSQGMLKQAREKAARLNIRNVEFIEGDMQDLGFAEGRFDAAVCAFGVFFVEDMDAQLARIAATVRPGGTVAICNFEEHCFSPMRELLMNRLAAYGVHSTSLIWKRIANEAACRDFFARAGLRDICVRQKNLGYFLEDERQWWDIVWNAGYRRFIGELSPADRERLRREHLEEVAALATPEGLWLNMDVLFTTGTKA